MKMNDIEGENKREFTRVSIKMKVRVTHGDTVIFSEEGKDISMKGLYLYCDKTLPVGTECDVTIFFGDLEINTKGIVKRSTESALAVEFTQLDIESYDHLQNLIIYNTSEIDRVEEEFKSHLGIKRR